MKNIVYLLLLSLVITSCAVNQKVQYDNLKIDVSDTKAKSISLALLDHRVAVVDGSQKPDFVGYMRSNVGIAYPIATKSKNTYIDDLSENIAESFKRFGINTSIIQTSYKNQEHEVKQQLFQTSDEKKILFIFDELHTDGYAIQVLHYKIDLFVYDNNNELLQYKKFDGERKLGGTVAFGAGPYKKYMPEAIIKLFEDMLNDQQILAALNKKK